MPQTHEDIMNTLNNRKRSRGESLTSETQRNKNRPKTNPPSTRTVSLSSGLTMNTSQMTPPAPLKDTSNPSSNTPPATPARPMGFPPQIYPLGPDQPESEGHPDRYQDPHPENPLNSALSHPPTNSGDEEMNTPTTMPSLIQTPEDGNEDYNVVLPQSPITYQVQGINSENLHLNLHKVSTQSWANSTPHAILIVPFFMSYSRKKMTDSRDHAATFLNRAFPLSPNLSVIATIPSDPIDEHATCPQDDPHPWSLMVHNLRKEDARPSCFTTSGSPKPSPSLSSQPKPSSQNG